MQIAVVGYDVRFASADGKEAFWSLLNRTEASSPFGPCPASRGGNTHVGGGVGAAYVDAPDTTPTSLLRRTTARALDGVATLPDASRIGLVSTELSFPTTEDYELARELYQTPWCADRTKRRFHRAAGLEVAEELGLGPVRLALDAACASAIYAVQVAERYLERGDVDVMLCGGVCLSDPAYVQTGFEAMGALAPSNSAPFCATSDGLATGDGAAMYVLKRLEDAQRDGDRIYGVLHDVRTRNAGKGSALRPNLEAEVRCLTVPNAQVERVDYVECHATGTRVGDALELEAVQRVFGTEVRVGSCKGNVGHALVCAGFAGLAKLLLSMEHGVVPATPRVATPLGAAVLTAPLEGALAHAGLNAFGFGGTNGHLRVSREWGPAVPTPRPPALEELSVVGLRAVDERLASGGTFFGPLPAHRWRGLDDRVEVPTRGAWCDRVRLDYKAWGASRAPEDLPLPRHLLAVSVGLEAVRDAGLPQGANVAVLVGLGTDDSLNRFRAVSEGVPAVSYPTKTANVCAFSIGNVTATRLASACDFRGPAFTIDEEARSAQRCVDVASQLLARGEVDAVLVVAVDVADAERAWALGPDAPIGEGAAAVVLRRDGGAGRYATLRRVGAPDAPTDRRDVWGDLGRADGAASLVAAVLAARRGSASGWDGYSLVDVDADRALPSTPPLGRTSVDAPVCAFAPREDVLWNAKDLLQYAEGDLEPVFGPAYAPIDAYKRRVRLPQRDYLLCTRVTKMRATTNVYEPCTMTTEYDLPIDGPFSRGGDIPWAILVEAGQCDLMLISYLGIDFQNKSERVYRLLDTTLTFHGVAHEGETLRYDIAIDSFAKQGEKLLFFFHYDCYVGDKLLIEMRGGAAGFFTDQELADGKGVVFGAAERKRRALPPTQTSTPFHVAPCAHKTTFDEADMRALCDRRWAEVLGPSCDGLVAPFTTPKILMIDRITHLRPNGGQHGLGLLVGEKTLARDHWYFPCHFKDDEVMAGSLVSDGCAQLLKVYMAWLGLHVGGTDVQFRPIYGLGNKVRCRGQIAPHAGKLVYVLEVKELGHDANGCPYLNADVNILDVDAEQGQTFDFDVDWPKYGQGDPDHRIVVDFHNVGLHLEGGRKPTNDVALTLGYASEDHVVQGKALAPHTVLYDALAGPTYPRHHRFQQHRGVDATSTSLEVRAVGAQTKALVGGRPVATLETVAAAAFEGRPLPAVVDWREGVDYEAIGAFHGPTLRAMRAWARDGERVLVRCASTVPQGARADTLLQCCILGKRVLYPTDAWSYLPTSTTNHQLAPIPTTFVVGIWSGTTLPNPQQKDLRWALWDDAGALVLHGGSLVSGIPSYRRKTTPPVAAATRETRTTLDWHPLAGVDGNPTPSFEPTALAPRPIAFVPFPNNPLDRDHTPGTMPLTWYNICEFAYGKLSECFGPAFAKYDTGSTASRMPGFELQLVTRILSAAKTDQPKCATMVSEFDCPSDAWFYAKNKGVMPYAVLMELGLQTSGFLSALTVALKMKHPDPMFRNLDADATLLEDVDVRGKTITNRTRATSFSFMGTMMIHAFAFELSVDGRVFYRGTTSFGWFEPKVFEKQVGLDKGAQRPAWHVALRRSTRRLPQPERDPQLRFVDAMVWSPTGGENGLGYVHGTKRIVPDDWFFSCHFWKDPVMPGSLGVEALLSLLEAYARATGVEGTLRHATHATQWKYRGQLVPRNETMEVALHVTEVSTRDGRTTLRADGELWVDGLRIYRVTNLGLVASTVVPSTVPSTVVPSTAPSTAPSTPSTGPSTNAFCRALGVRLPVFASSMAKGLSSAELVIAMGKAGLLASFGAGGLPPDAVDAGLRTIKAALGPDQPWCVNLIHSPFDPSLERRNVDLFLQHGVTIVEASAFMDITPSIVRYRAAGLRVGTDGATIVGHRLIAKMSRTELAARFLAPPPAKILARLVEAGEVTAEQARLAATLPLCDFLTCEADSGGHTDNRAALVLLPTVLRLRDRLGVDVPVGLAGGIGCPAGVRAAFAMGAAYVGIGTIAQPCRESGTCDAVRAMLCQAKATDVAMAAAADMFTQGVQLQVLKSGTMFAQRANHLYDLYKTYDDFEAMPTDVRRTLETKYFQCSIDEVWAATVDFYTHRLQDLTKVRKAETDRKLHMDLCMRWYLGNSSRWANTGTKGRKLDYQVWCGPAIGSFNDWIAGTDLDPKVAGAYPSIVDVCERLMT